MKPTVLAFNLSPTREARIRPLAFKNGIKLQAVSGEGYERSISSLLDGEVPPGTIITGDGDLAAERVCEVERQARVDDGAADNAAGIGGEQAVREECEVVVDTALRE